MDDGKRAAAIAKFMELLPTRADVGNTRFRANVRFYLIEEFGCTGNAASTHYNHAFQKCKQTNPELLVALTGGAAGEVPALGRAEGKNNGGRKKKVVSENATTEGAAEGDAETTTVVEETTTAPVVEAELVNVYKKKDNTLVLFGVPRADGEAAVAKAAAGKKAALYIA